RAREWHSRGQGFDPPYLHPLTDENHRVLVPTRLGFGHIFATGTEHLEHPAIRVRLSEARFDHGRRDLAPMVLRHVDVDHRLVDPLVAHPGLQPPRVHPEQRGMRPEAVAQRVPALLRWRIANVPRGTPRDARMTPALRAGIDRAAAQDRRTATDWILRVLEDAVAESDDKADKSAK